MNAERRSSPMAAGSAGASRRHHPGGQSLADSFGLQRPAGAFDQQREQEQPRRSGRARTRRCHPVAQRQGDRQLGRTSRHGRSPSPGETARFWSGATGEIEVRVRQIREKLASSGIRNPPPTDAWGSRPAISRLRRPARLTFAAVSWSKASRVPQQKPGFVRATSSSRSMANPSPASSNWRPWWQNPASALLCWAGTSRLFVPLIRLGRKYAHAKPWRKPFTGHLAESVKNCYVAPQQTSVHTRTVSSTPSEWVAARLLGGSLFFWGFTPRPKSPGCLLYWPHKRTGDTSWPGRFPSLRSFATIFWPSSACWDGDG